MEITFTYDDTEYRIKDITIEQYANIIAKKDILEEDAQGIRIINLLTGLKEEEIREINADSINDAVNAIYELMINQDEKFYEYISHNGKEYQFLDLKNMSFGEFIDVDTFLQRGENYKNNNLNELMALLYQELENGKRKKFDTYDFYKKREDFKTLPVKYVFGALRFFLNIGLVSPDNTINYLLLKLKWKLVSMSQKKQMKKASKNFGVGMQQ